MHILGIDPGSHRTGWGVIRLAGSKLRHVDSGTVRAAGATLAERLSHIAQALEDILSAYAPAAVAVETVFYAKNARSALLLGHARGVSLASAARCGVPVFEYTAGQIKQAATGRGRAAKEQVQQMVASLLGVHSGTSLDTSDALAAAICHAHAAAGPSLAALGDGKRRPEQSNTDKPQLRSSIRSFRNEGA